MTYYNDEERQAGALLLSQLKMFNQAAVVFENQIEPAFSKGFDQCVKQFVMTSDWHGESDIEEDDYLWISPSSWYVSEDKCKCWFENYQTESGEKDYLLAVLTHNATEKTAYGFRLTLDTGIYGGVRNLKHYVNEKTRPVLERLAAMGFEDHGKGNFFIPLYLDVGQLTECWREYGKFPPEHALFDPLKHVLAKLKEAVPLFDEILVPLQKD